MSELHQDLRTLACKNLASGISLDMNLKINVVKKQNIKKGVRHP